MTSEDDHRPVSAHLPQNINDRASTVKNCAMPSISWQCSQNKKYSFKAIFNLCINICVHRISLIPHSENSKKPPEFFPFSYFRPRLTLGKFCFL